MSVIVGLMILGFALIMAEILIPGGIVGAIGGLCLLGAVGFAFEGYGIEGALIAFLVGLLGAGLCLYVEFKIMPKTKLGQKLFLGDRIMGDSHTPGRVPQDDLVGAEGRALTALAPSGYVEVSGKRIEAVSRSGFLERGQAVRVESAKDFKIIVSKI